MNKSILFIAPYPTSATISDGLAQRVQHIDDCFSSYNRIYLEISFYRNLKAQTVSTENLIVHKLNCFIHFLKIAKLFKQNSILYFHSAYNVFRAIFYLNLISNKAKVIFDVHGVVPEELEFMGNRGHSLLMKYAEEKIFKRANSLIYVTEAMRSYYTKKYKDETSGKRNIVYSITPGTNTALEAKKLNLLQKELNISDEDVVFIYSGSTQKWQNVELLFKSIKSISNPNYKFIILSGELEKIKDIALEQGLINRDNIIFRRVAPSELGYYYQLANYGFILRDDHILNKVANPTKLVEYLTFGIVPIVKSEAIGDFMQLGYEHVKIENLNSFMPKTKSFRNKEIALSMMRNSNNLQEMLFGEEAVAAKN